MSNGPETARTATCIQMHLALVSRFSRRDHGVFRGTNYDHFLYLQPVTDPIEDLGFDPGEDLPPRVRLCLVKRYSLVIEGLVCTFATLHNHAIAILVRAWREWRKRIRDPRRWAYRQVHGGVPFHSRRKKSRTSYFLY